MSYVLLKIGFLQVESPDVVDCVSEGDDIVPVSIVEMYLIVLIRYSS